MTEREQAVNRRLCTLDEAHRLGRISREDYRARRRELLAGLRDSNGVTARNAITPQAGGRAARAGGREAAPGAALHLLFPGRRTAAWVSAVVVLAGVLAVLLYWWLGHS